MLDVKWRQIARRDLEAIVDYISDDNVDAAEELRAEIEERVANLALQPKIYKPGRFEGTREMIVRGNYIVVYEENDVFVRVLRVLHAARNWPQ